MSGVSPHSAYGRLLCRVLAQLDEVLFCDESGRPVRVAIAGLNGAMQRDPVEVGRAWTRVTDELDALEGGCAAGPLPAVLFDVMVHGSYGYTEPLDACWVHAIDQARQCLPGHDDDWDLAVETLVDQVDSSFPDQLEICVAIGTVVDGLRYMIVTGAGGALAEFLEGWLTRHGCSPSDACGCPVE